MYQPRKKSTSRKQALMSQDGQTLFKNPAASVPNHFGTLCITRLIRTIMWKIAPRFRLL